MKRVKVTFKSKCHFESSGRNDIVSYVVESNNVEMGIAKARYSLWRDLGDARFDYSTHSASFVSK